MILAKSKPLFFLLSMTIFLTQYIYGQGGTIEGIVTDRKTNETLVGAQILIMGTTTGTTANLNGEYRITKIQPGIIDLQISFISYEPVIVENISIERGRTLTINVELEEVSQVLEGVTVTARRTTYTETSLIQSIRTSQVVTSGISAQQIARSQDSDAAQVVRRIPGVTIIEDRFIIVRGLSERYNATLFHNAYAPSLEPDVRSFSFDMVPSSQIDHLLVFKSPSPDLPGDFAGGVVKIITKSLPDKSGIDFSYTSQYDQGTTFNPFLKTERSSNYWTSFGSDYFALPESFPNDVRTITNNPDLLQQHGRSLRNNWVPMEENAFLSHSGSLSGSLRFNLGKIKLGNITTLTYGNSKSTNEIFRADFNAYNFVDNRSLPLYEFEDSRYSNNVRLGVLHNWGIEITDKHTIEIVNLYNNTSSYRYINRLGDHLDFGFTMNNHAFQQIFRGLYTGQITGKHELTRTTNLDWTYGQSRSFREMPDYKQYRSERPINDTEGETYFIYVPIGGAQPYFMGRFYSNMQESGMTYSANISQKINLGFSKDFVPEFKAGFFAEDLERDFRARNIGYTQSVGFSQGLREVSIDSLFHPENINNFGGFKIDEQSNPNDSYDAANSLFAWYAMMNIPINHRFNIVGGVRIENNRRIMNSATTEGPVSVDNKETFILPSVNATFNISDDLLLRAGYGKTINRPEFREQAPFGFFDFDNNWVITGNPFLKTAEITNYDLRIEYYPSLSEVISLAGFYKEFDNAIERVVLIGAGSGGSKNFSFGNADNSKIYGSEVEVKKELLGLTSSKFINDLSVYMNGTILFSEVEIGSGSRSQGRDTDPRPLQGQSAYIVNAGLFYNNIESNLEINILYNVIGKRLFSGGIRELDGVTTSYPDIYEMPRNYIDITMSKRLTRNLSLRLKAEDILNEYVIFLQDANEDGIFDKENDQLLRRYKPGITLKAGLVFRL
jgi:outer membrane receptor for ferrienterochelin and colicin